MLFCLASGAAFGAMAVFGKLAYAEGATVGTLLACASSSPPVCSGSAAPARRMPPRAGHRDRRWASARAATRSRPAATSRRWSASTRRCSRCSSTRSRRWWRSAPWRSAANACRGGGPPRSSSPPAGWRWSSPGGLGALDPLGAALGLAAAVLYSGYILVSDGLSQRMSPLAAGGARLHRRGGRADGRRRAARRVPAGRADRRRLGVDRLPRGASRPSARSGSSSPACGASARPRPRSSRPSSRSSPSCSRSRSSASRSARCSSRAARSCSPRY